MELIYDIFKIQVNLGLKVFILAIIFTWLLKQGMFRALAYSQCYLM